MAQAFLTAGEKRGLIARFDDDDPIRIETRLRQGRSEQICTRDAPQDPTLRPSGDACRKEYCRGPMQGPSGAAGDFMQGCDGEARSRKYVVDMCKAKREPCRFGAFGANAAYLLPKLAQNRVVSQVGLPNMFLICSKWREESNLIVSQFECVLGKGLRFSCLRAAGRSKESAGKAQTPRTVRTTPRWKA